MSLLALKMKERGRAKKCNGMRNQNLSSVYSQQKTADLNSFNGETLYSAND